MHSCKQFLPLRPSTALMPAALIVGLTIGSLTGCSLMVMAGKAVFGDPVLSSAFETQTRIDLAEECQKNKKKVIVTCSTPEIIKADFPSLDFDLLSDIARQLRRREITVVSPDKVARWMDDHGGSVGDLSELAEHFEADYIIHVDLTRFTFKKENSPTLLQGRAIGNVYAYKVEEEEDEHRHARQIFVSGYDSTYPKLHPFSVQQITEKVFLKRFRSRVSTEISRLFFDHRATETIE